MKDTWAPRNFYNRNTQKTQKFVQQPDCVDMWRKLDTKYNGSV